MVLNVICALMVGNFGWECKGITVNLMGLFDYNENFGIFCRNLFSNFKFIGSDFNPCDQNNTI